MYFFTFLGGLVGAAALALVVGSVLGMVLFNPSDEEVAASKHKGIDY